MLGSITIRGFKSIVEAEIELGRLNVFIGANGSGKSVVLEAIGVLGAAADGRVDDASLLRRGVRPGVPALYKNAFAHHDIPRVITFNARSNEAVPVVYDVSLDNPIEHGGTPWRFTHELLAVGTGKRTRKYVSRGPGGAKLWGARGKTQSFKPKDPTRSVADTPNPLGEPPDAVRRFMDRLMNYAIYDPQTPILRGIVTEENPLHPLGLGGGRLTDALFSLLMGESPGIDAVQAAFHNLIGWAQDVNLGWTQDVNLGAVLPPATPQPKLLVHFVDRFMRKGRNTLSANDASEGALYVLFALILLHHELAPRTFAIENIDHALHPRLARKLVEVISSQLKEHDRQVLLTTHNPLVLDALDLRDDDVRLFTVDRDKHGPTVIRRLAFTEALRKAQESGLTLSQMWTRGLIGAVPNIL
ncbi:MAG: AAA family ATPase [Hyalangium sp.]|uniref:AAA family ATPase n=1 Tax=Hyalangium sp. TaxID=2028555 RepID=UPI0038999CBE